MVPTCFNILARLLHMEGPNLLCIYFLANWNPAASVAHACWSRNTSSEANYKKAMRMDRKLFTSFTKQIRTHFSVFSEQSGHSNTNPLNRVQPGKTSFRRNRLNIHLKLQHVASHHVLTSYGCLFIKHRLSFLESISQHQDSPVPPHIQSTSKGPPMDRKGLSVHLQDGNVSPWPHPTDKKKSYSRLWKRLPCPKRASFKIKFCFLLERSNAFLFFFLLSSQHIHHWLHTQVSERSLLGTHIGKTRLKNMSMLTPVDTWSWQTLWPLYRIHD